jgi:hypothetical protein
MWDVLQFGHALTSPLYVLVMHCSGQNAKLLNAETCGGRVGLEICKNCSWRGVFPSSSSHALASALEADK